MKLLEGGRQYNSQVDWWEAIKTIMSEIESSEVKKKFIKSMVIDHWLFLRSRVTLLKCKGLKDL